jgi:hypothetical protein
MDVIRLIGGLIIGVLIFYALRKKEKINQHVRDSNPMNNVKSNDWYERNGNKK